MTGSEATVALFGGVGTFLAAASLVGWTLQRRSDGQPSATVENLNARIKAWWIMVALLAVAFLFGRTGVIVLFAFASFAALREFLTLTNTRRGDHHALAAAFFIVLPVQYWLIWDDWYGLYSIFIPVYVFLLMPIAVALRGDTTNFMERIAEVQWGVMVAIFCVSHVPALMTLPIPGFDGRELMLIAFLVIVVQASDVLQYVFGKLFGRHKVAPALSPSKTWEGLVGGVASATALGTGLWWITPFGVGGAAALAFLICLMGFLGGLVMSAIKRDRGVKDWGRLIEGHGGMLDRLDSVVFAAPVFFHVVRYYWTI